MPGVAGTYAEPGGAVPKYRGTAGTYPKAFRVLYPGIECMQYGAKPGWKPCPDGKAVPGLGEGGAGAEKIPSFTEYEQHASYTRTPLKSRCERWTLVPTAMRQHMEAKKLTEDWPDVLAIITAYEKQTGVDEALLCTPLKVTRPKLREDRTVYGPPVGPAAVSHGPTNELGVIYLFGTLAERLGFVVIHIQHAFPDCEAMRRVGDDQWQRVLIEFEYESRNFVRHLHDANGCDLIVCWKHNWEECPLEVVELRAVIRMQ